MPCPDSAVPEKTARDDPGLYLCHALASWREELARSIARNNFGVRSDEIAESVNRIIFFLVILRIAGDRGFVGRDILTKIPLADDPYRILLDFARISGDAWENIDIESVPRRTQIKDLVIEERVVRSVFTQALISDDTCGLATLPVTVLGSIFSQYLKQTVKVSAAHRAIVVDTRDTILSSGIRQPSRGIIKYMVESGLRTAGRNRSKHETLPLRVADPACGSGEVLLAAFFEMVDKQYGSRSTFIEKRQILFDSIHGVDVDRHAVAATRTLLVIGLLEGENPGSLPSDFFAAVRDAFRDLRYTIRLGNALINPGIAQDDCWMFMSPRERHDLNPFSWESGFPEIFAAGGFDSILGILPGGKTGQKDWIHQFLQRFYEVYDPEIDRSVYSVESGLSILRPGGILACCMSNNWLRGRAGGPFRAFLKKKELVELVDFSGTSGNKNDSGLCILRVINCTAGPEKFHAVIADPAACVDLNAFVKADGFPVDPAELLDGGWVIRDVRVENLFMKLAAAGTRLRNVVMGQIRAGTVVDTAFVIDRATRRRLVRADPRCKTHIRPVVSGRNIGRFRIDTGDRFVIFVSRGWTGAHPASSTNPWHWFKRRFPPLARHLKQTGADKKKPETPEDYWWEGGGFDPQPKMQPGILFPEKFRNPAFAYDNGRSIADETVNVIESSNLYLLGLLNSRLVGFVIRNSRKESGAGRENFSRSDLMDVPVYIPDLDDPADRIRHDRLVAQVTRLIDREKKLQEIHHEPEVVRLKKEIAEIRKKIDVLVYDLYRLTKEEIAVIESDSPV